jgi:hypothetical protein
LQLIHILRSSRFSNSHSGLIKRTVIAKLIACFTRAGGLKTLTQTLSKHLILVWELMKNRPFFLTPFCKADATDYWQLISFWLDSTESKCRLPNHISRQVELLPQAGPGVPHEEFWIPCMFLWFLTKFVT